MKLSLISLALSASCFAAAQLPPPPGGSGMPRLLSRTSPQTTSQQTVGGGATSTSYSTSSASSVPTETIRVLSMSSVQQKLELTSAELSSLAQISRTIPAATTSEEEAYSAVSKVLSVAQTTRLKGLMVQDLGYGSLALSSVRSALSLSEAQSNQISSIVAALETSKRSILSTASNPSMAIKMVSRLAAKADANLAKVLTSAQDAQLRALATQQTPT